MNKTLAFSVRGKHLEMDVHVNLINVEEEEIDNVTQQFDELKEMFSSIAPIELTTEKKIKSKSKKGE